MGRGGGLAGRQANTEQSQRSCLTSEIGCKMRMIIRPITMNPSIPQVFFLPAIRHGDEASRPARHGQHMGGLGMKGGFMVRPAAGIVRIGRQDHAFVLLVQQIP